MRKIVRITGLDCAHCASHLEKNLKKIKGIISINLNFLAERLTLEIDDLKVDEVIEEIKVITKKLHPEVIYRGI